KEARAAAEAAQRRYLGLANVSDGMIWEDDSAQERPLCGSPINRAILSSVPAHIALLDCEGVIIAVNDAWERFNRENTPAVVCESHAMIGANYLTVCENAARNHSEIAREALTGIQAVLRREREIFTMEYPCRMPESTQWYLLRATPLPESVGGAVVSHLNVT